MRDLITLLVGLRDIGVSEIVIGVARLAVSEVCKTKIAYEIQLQVLET